MQQFPKTQTPVRNTTYILIIIVIMLGVDGSNINFNLHFSFTFCNALDTTAPLSIWRFMSLASLSIELNWFFPIESILNFFVASYIKTGCVSIHSRTGFELISHHYVVCNVHLLYWCDRMSDWDTITCSVGFMYYTLSFTLHKLRILCFFLTKFTDFWQSFESAQIFAFPSDENKKMNEKRKQTEWMFERCVSSMSPWPLARTHCKKNVKRCDDEEAEES